MTSTIRIVDGVPGRAAWVDVAGVAGVAGSRTTARLPMFCPLSLSAMLRTFWAEAVCGAWPHVAWVFRPVARSASTSCIASVLVGSIFAPLPLTSSVDVGFVGALTPAVLMMVGFLPGTFVILGRPLLGMSLTIVPGAEASGL